MNRARGALSPAIRMRARICARTILLIEALESREVLSGGVPPGMDLAQANWFYQNTFAAQADVATGWNGNVASGDAGTLGANYLAAIAARVNDYRWMAGLPGGVMLDSTENTEAQLAALMMAANNQLSHSPPPTWLDYSAAGAGAAGHSDLTLGASGTSAIDLYMTDPGAGNTFVGHRRWVLYPSTRTMGVGDIPGQSNALYVVQPELAPAPAVTAVAWPPAGFVPVTLMPLRWSLQSDGNTDFSNATVSVTENGTPQTVEILSDNSSGYGGNAIVWDMPFAPAPQYGQQAVYTVNIGNVMVAGKPQSFSYSTTSFDPSTTTALEPVPAQVEFLQPLAQVSSNSGSIVIEVARSMNADQQVSINYATTSGTAKSGTNYVATSGTLTFVPGQFYSQIVVPILAGSSHNAGGTFTISLTTPSGATIGPVSTVQVSISGSPSVAYQPLIGTVSSTTSQSIGTTAPVEVSVEEIFQTRGAGRSRLTRRASGRLAGFQLTFSQPLDASSATIRTNYAILEYHSHGRRMVAQPVTFRASYDASTDRVSLILIGNHRFSQGGRLILKAMLSSTSSGLAAGSTVFSILPGATGITP
jgi:Calx-beta domain/Cysteine-rich secretory protein family